MECCCNWKHRVRVNPKPERHQHRWTVISEVNNQDIIVQSSVFNRADQRTVKSKNHRFSHGKLLTHMSRTPSLLGQETVLVLLGYVCVHVRQLCGALLFLWEPRNQLSCGWCGSEGSFNNPNTVEFGTMHGCMKARTHKGHAQRTAHHIHVPLAVSACRILSPRCISPALWASCVSKHIYTFNNGGIWKTKWKRL